VKDRRLGKLFYAPTDCILAETTIVQPDIVFVDAGRLPIISERGIEGSPSLVVEVLSPSTTHLDRGSKAQLYARHRGCPRTGSSTRRAGPSTPTRWAKAPTGSRPGSKGRRPGPCRPSPT